MNYIYYKSNKGNFGDDLNEWLWPEFFGNQNDESENYFLGIGSILFNDFPLIKNLGSSKKIVFGTGIRQTNRPLALNETWDCVFLRGPLSQQYIGDNTLEYIADAAYAFRLSKKYNKIKNTPKKHKVSLIPYFKSVDIIDWKSLCNTLNFNYISPESINSIDFILEEIASSEYIITEAMHGAILADILRVPWHRYIFTTPNTEGASVSEFKWMDWYFSLNLGYPITTKIQFFRKTRLNDFFLRMTNGVVNASFFLKSRVIEDLIGELSQINEFYLSNDSKIKEIDEKIFEKIQYVKRMYVLK